MEYTIKNLAALAGISTRTLRYYDEIGLLRPNRISPSGYRIYGRGEVDALQQILFYRELGVGLDEIKNILTSPDFNGKVALENHLASLLEKQNQLNLLINNVKRTLSAAKGEIIMKDNEKFEGFKQKMIEDNESGYGTEIRKKYGAAAVDGSNKKVLGMSEADWNKAQELSAEINETLKTALKQRDPAGAIAQKACDLHRQWLCMFWEDDAYSKEAHKSLGDMYVADERFKAYYDGIEEGCAEFLRNALYIYCM